MDDAIRPRSTRAPQARGRPGRRGAASLALRERRCVWPRRGPARSALERRGRAGCRRRRRRAGRWASAVIGGRSLGGALGGAGPAGRRAAVAAARSGARSPASARRQPKPAADPARRRTRSPEPAREAADAGARPASQSARPEGAAAAAATAGQHRQRRDRHDRLHAAAPSGRRLARLARSTAAPPTAPPAGPAGDRVARDSPTPSSSTRPARQDRPVRRPPSTRRRRPELTKALLQRPPRQPADVEVPKAKVLNVVPGPSHGDDLHRSASRCCGSASPASCGWRCEQLKNGGWQVTDVLG